ncbi:sensor histidine kinase [Cyclobacterium jeungdonense]|uniref:histidine kinase n=1 Tax=Cyclobacterium jeungdonense TaxID=708087 RepID=A0ABT8CAL1_9BACT|nr:ATP-binding protein [Cyclobacterium jeungdonense]MDN3689815.1 ATP-binding protein [Cyclobacterium jeungdonense]
MRRGILGGNLNRPFFNSVIAFIGAMLIVFIISYRVYVVGKSNELFLVREQTRNIKEKIENSLNYSVSSTRLLAFLVEKDLVVSDFESLAGRILSANQSIDALQLVEGGVIVKTYPLEGNEAVIGLRITDNVHHRRASEKAKARNSLYFEGPFALKQGGMGLVGRLPVYRNDKFWGFSAVVIKLDSWIESLQLGLESTQELYSIHLAKINDDGVETYFSFSGDEIQTNGLYQTAYIEEGDWKLYVRLNNPRHLQEAGLFLVFGLIFSGLLAGFVYQKTAEPIKLRRLVSNKTDDLEVLNQKLKNRAADLSRSNQELEQFAYIASHDLQEPLRMISSFLALLEKKYGQQLDDRARKYIFYAVDGSNRMRQIILGLLEFSRVGKNGGKQEKVDLTQVMEGVCQVFRNRIRELDATVQALGLPVVHGYHFPLIQVFQNLMSNALKYHSEERRPEIRVSAYEEGDFWKVSIQDNGIGIAPEYFDRIFDIFIRVHRKEEYEGTGIGLATVKKIIERWGGRVGVESQLGVGSTFYFTIPKKLVNTN